MKKKILPMFVRITFGFLAEKTKSSFVLPFSQKKLVEQLFIFLTLLWLQAQQCHFYQNNANIS